MSEAELRELFLKVSSGNDEAFIQVYEGLKQPIFTVICRIVRSRETAEDLTHELFLRLLESPPDFRVKNLRAYIFQMARNLAIDALRRERCNGDIDGMEIPERDCIESYIASWDIESAMARLPQDAREIVTLHLTAELGFAEISKIVGCSVSSVFRKYRKAIAALREQINGGYL